MHKLYSQKANRGKPETNKYRNVLIIELATPIHALRAKRNQHLPTVLTKNEVTLVLNGMHDPMKHQALLVAARMYPHTLEKMRYTPSRNDH